MDMNSADVLQWLKSFIHDEYIIKVFQGNFFFVFFIQIILHYINTRTS